MFPDVEFERALEELQAPVLDDFERFTETADIVIYRKYRPSSGLYEYKTNGFMNCNADICHKVYMDLNYRKTWDSYVKDLYEVQSDNGPVIYWNVNFPFPLSKRDYTFVRESRQFTIDGKQTWVILAESRHIPSIPETKKAIRVKEYKCFLVIQECGEQKTKAFMHYFDNPGGSIPCWLINWAAKTGVPSFLEEVRKACERYPQYILQS